MKIVQFDLAKYLQRNIFPSRTVLVFPPFNGFRRFLIHKLIEDNFTSKDLAAFSIGQDIARRIVVCYKGLVRTDQSKQFEDASKQSIQYNMIDKEKQASKQKSSSTVSVYRPPAARMTESRQRTDTLKTDTGRTRVRRPDQQMYVPRPRRSLNNSDESSQSHSSSRTSLEFDSCENITSTKCETINRLDLDKTSVIVNQSPPPRLKKTPASLPKSHKEVNSDSAANSSNADLHNTEELASGRNTMRPFQDIGLSEKNHCSQPNESLNKVSSLNDDFKSGNNLNCDSSSDLVSLKNNPNTTDYAGRVSELCAGETQSEVKNPKKQETKNLVPSCKTSEQNCPNGLFNNSEAMDIISISSESRCDESTSSGESRCSDNSSETEVEKDSNSILEQNLTLKKRSLSTKASRTEKEQAECNNVITSCDSSVLIISDSSSDSFQSRENDLKEVNSKKGKSGKKMVKKKPKLVNPEDCDWETLYNDSGECLVPNLMEELTNSVGRVKVASVDSDYRSYQSIEERTNDGECVIEIYDFPAEFKTTDLFNIFASYRSKNFQIKWVDDTHALGVFPSPIIADEVLACTLPFVKTRPLRLGTPESKSKARNLVLPVLPPMERPKTCPALARRLVSGALGLRLPTSLQDREKEKQVLKEAREKRRLEAKQREAAWDGTLTSIL